MSIRPAEGGDTLARQRWERIGLGVRLAYNPWHPGAIRCYLQAGAQLARGAPTDELKVQQRMLRLLLQTAADEALPWCWRSACHEYAVFPLARLATLWRRGLAPHPQAWQQRADALACRLEQIRSPTDRP